MEILVFVIVGGIAGFLASKVLTGKGMGLLGDIVVGIVGAFVGFFLAGLLHIPIANIFVEVIVAFVGALILLVVFRAVTRRGMIHT